MESCTLPSPAGENFADLKASDRFYRLTTAEVIHFRECKYSPSVVTVYCYIKTLDPFGQGLQIVPKQAAKHLKYHHRTVSRAINTLTKAGELALAIVEAHVKLVAQSVETVTTIVSKLGLGNNPAPESTTVPTVETVTTPEPPQPEPAPLPVTPIPLPASQSPIDTRSVKSGAASIGNVIANMGLSAPCPSQPQTDPDSTSKTPQWYDRIEFRLNALDIKLADVLHALKKYPVRAIEDAIAYTQKQTWSKAKAGVFVNYLKKWTPTTNAVKSKPNATPEPVKTALMKRFPDIATTLSQEQNPIDEATLDYLQRLKVAGGIYDMQYSSIHNFFGVFITIKDYPHPIPWWDAVPQLQRLYPI
ncbi:hypothetical protein [Chamaesiphon polymorphus]|uniref:Uncharacterized protein n=1 Tax=Chamaesiphon polymorphus CCALA 037 TaxID=2107692 RepID=A0A2T1GGP4_9CYAN|nr:hypothetical protein [Chamaesiphon polymorphus]PSB56831.1 hypothetical protein C7B77_10560 [Chamaesiphon polymorphus CCALA 037]